jgi:hypothetical protein
MRAEAVSALAETASAPRKYLSLLPHKPNNKRKSTNNTGAFDYANRNISKANNNTGRD